MIAGAEAAVWTERMLSALVNGVKGGKKKVFFAGADRWRPCRPTAVYEHAA